MLIVALALVGCDGGGNIQTTGGKEMPVEEAIEQFGSAGAYSESIDPKTYLERLFLDPFDPSIRLYIPKYCYFQGLAYSQQKLDVIGQVRFVGGGVAQGDIGLRDGGMVTTNPDYLLGRFQPSRPRYQVLEWKEGP